MGPIPTAVATVKAYFRESDFTLVANALINPAGVIDRAQPNGLNPINPVLNNSERIGWNEPAAPDWINLSKLTIGR